MLSALAALAIGACNQTANTASSQPPAAAKSAAAELAVEYGEFLAKPEELISAAINDIAKSIRLNAAAMVLGKTVYDKNCAACHGADLKGNQAKGAPNLSDDIWLYDYGRVTDIERTILYGIRSGNSKAHNVTDMPPLGRAKAITVAEIKDVMVFVRSLKTKEGDPAVIARGERARRPSAGGRTSRAAERAS